jgi:hypothetical protein
MCLFEANFKNRVPNNPQLARCICPMDFGNVRQSLAACAAAAGLSITRLTSMDV